MTADQVQELRVMLTEIKGDVKAIRAENVAADGIHKDHETRLRALERVRWIATGAALLIGGGLGSLLEHLSR